MAETLQHGVHETGVADVTKACPCALQRVILVLNLPTRAFVPAPVQSLSQIQWCLMHVRVYIKVRLRSVGTMECPRDALSRVLDYSKIRFCAFIDEPAHLAFVATISNSLTPATRLWSASLETDITETDGTARALPWQGCCRCHTRIFVVGDVRYFVVRSTDLNSRAASIPAVKCDPHLRRQDFPRGSRLVGRLETWLALLLQCELHALVVNCGWSWCSCSG